LPNNTEKLKELEKAVISTLAYFKVHKYPLTLMEIYKWLYVDRIKNLELRIKGEAIKISDIQKSLDEGENLKKIIKCKNGFYYLVGDENLVELRKKRHNLAQGRWKKLRRIATILQVIPNIKMIAACNTLVLNDIKEDSDIDVFVIIKDGRMWQTRFFITTMVALLGQWRHKDNIANKICLSFYITDRKMNLEWLSKKPYDPMLTYWVTFLYPLLDRGTYDKFIAENNWVRKFVPHFIKYNPNILERKVAKVYIFDILKKLLEVILDTKIGDFIEKLFKKIQEGKMKKNSKSWQRNDTDVVINDQMLKFHEKDRRDYFREVYEENLKNIFSPLIRGD
jgi:hypothetical protein